MSVPSVKRIGDTLMVCTNTARRIRGLMAGSVDPETSLLVRAWLRQCWHRPSRLELAMVAVDEALGTFGVEAITGPEWLDSFHGNVVATYCNTGDSYCPTVLLCHKRGRFLLTSWGDYVEREGL